MLTAVDICRIAILGVVERSVALAEIYVTTRPAGSRVIIPSFAVLKSSEVHAHIHERRYELTRASATSSAQPGYMA